MRRAMDINKNAHNIPRTKQLTAGLRSASLNTMLGNFPPSSNVLQVGLCYQYGLHDPARDERRPRECDLVDVLVLRNTLADSTTFTTPGENLASLISEHLRSTTRGVNSDGLITTPFSVVRAGPSYNT